MGFPPVVYDVRLEDPPTLVLQLFERVIDSSEKLDITLFLFRVRFGSRTTTSIAEAVFLSPRRAGDAIVSLASAGVIRKIDAHGTAWWFDPNNKWGPHVEALARMYERSRAQVLELLTSRVLASGERLTTSGH